MFTLQVGHAVDNVSLCVRSLLAATYHAVFGDGIQALSLRIGSTMRWRIRTKVLLAFSGVSVLFLLSFGAVAFNSSRQLAQTAFDGVNELGSETADDAAAALEELGGQMIRQKAEDVAGQVAVYLASRPGWTIEELQGDADFAAIAVQSVGETGYTAMFEMETAITRFHPNPALHNFDLEGLSDRLPDMWALIESSLDGTSVGGYYAWEDADGAVRQKYMYITPVEGARYLITATTYVDEFSRPVDVIRSQINAARDNVRELIARQNAQQRQSFGFVFATLAAIVLALSLLLARRITRPIQTLSEGAERLGSGDLDARVDVRTKDELEQLGNAFNTMASDLSHHIEALGRTTAEKERIESELMIARSIQMGILPRIFPAFPERAEIDLYAVLEPAREVGGDLYDFFLLDDDHLCFLVGDVSGKGVPASLFMMLTKTLIKTKATRGLPANQILQRVNEDLSLDNPSMMFVTVFLGVLDLNNGEVEYANAGHNPPFVIKREGRVEAIALEAGVPLGIIEDYEFAVDRLSLEPGDSIFLYTDGITEAESAEGQFFSDERLIDQLNGTNEMPLQQGLDAMLAQVWGFGAGIPQSDDITMLAIRYLGATSAEE